jgi:hypothetical protein
MALTKISRSLLDTGVSDSSDATAITIDSSERVGIGTTNPPSKLTVSGSDGGKGIELQVSTGSVQYLMAYDRSASDYIDMSIDAENLRFGTNDGSERMRIDSSGNIGIGTTNGDVANDGVAARTYVGIIGNSNRGVLNIGSTAASGADGGKISFVNGANAIADIYADPDSGSQTNGFLQFVTGSASRMRITSSGHVLIGTTSAVSDSRLRVVSSGSSASEYTCEMGSADGTTQLLIRSDGAFFTGTDSNSPFNSAGASANVQVLSNGALTRVSSSRRYKQDITDATWGLDEVKQLRPVTFRSNRTDELCDPNVHGGFIAEEVHDIGGLTSFIGYDENNEAETLHYGNMVSLLTKAIQELSAKVEELESKINE